MSTKKSLAPSEREIMNAVWEDGGEVCASGLMARLASDWKYTTVATFLTRLEKKGFLSREKRGDKNYYRAALSREEYLSACADDFIEEMYGGAAHELIASLCKGRISSEDYDALMDILKKYSS